MVPNQFLLLPVPIPKQSQNLEPNHSVDFVSLLKFWTTTWSLGFRKNLFFFEKIGWGKGDRDVEAAREWTETLMMTLL